MPDGMMPVDIAVFAALGDVLGNPAETMSVIRQYVRPGGDDLVADMFLRDGGAATFPGFEHYRSRAETVAGLTAWGDVLVTKLLEGEAERDDDGGDDDAAAIYRRAVELARRHPDHREQLLAFATHQAAANAHIGQNLVDAMRVLRRSDV